MSASIDDEPPLASSDIAIIGMSGRFPGAPSIAAFWKNLRDGVESITHFTPAELEAEGIPAAWLRDARYVRAAAIINGGDVAQFDAPFFGFTPQEAALTDPQHRIFLEICWEALEQAGHIDDGDDTAVAVFAAAGLSTYLINHLLVGRDIAQSTSYHQYVLGNDKDFLATRVSYKLNLGGPSMTVQTGCSSSLVAVHLACQSLLGYQSDLALAGGVTVRIPQKTGYHYQEGGIFAPDGHCRAFDAKAQGTVFGSGAGVVLLRRLEDAIENGDRIYAVIKGAAINNDGARKVGFTAPSVDKQVEVIATAQALANVRPETIGYVEAHGTGTPLGDPIELQALTQVFRSGTAAEQFCGVGSVKTNVGHLDVAAGVAGLIKATLALEHKAIPPSLHFEKPNPELGLEHSPFYVNARLRDWEAGETPRRAGVSSFGMGGTNVHVILEEAPPVPAEASEQPAHLLFLSARTAGALERATADLAGHLEAQTSARAAIELADVAYTLQVGRRAFRHRRAVVCHDVAEAIAALRSPRPGQQATGICEKTDRPVVFMFPGQATQHVDMMRGLYEAAPVFRDAVDRSAELLLPELKTDLRGLLWPDEGAREAADQRLRETAITQPALFVVEYALAQLWMAQGLQPHAMIGHSIGEYVAACLAEVFSLEDALRLVAVRGRLVQSLPAGAMVSVQLSETELAPILPADLALAAVNGPSRCVVAGEGQAIDAFCQTLEQRRVTHQRLATTRAFHSGMIDPILEDFVDELHDIELGAPKRPYISTLTGDWITPEDATDPGYWARHLRHTVRFDAGLRHLLEKPDWLLLEVGPGRSLSHLARQHPARAPEQVVLASCRHAAEQQNDFDVWLRSVGEMWVAGGPVRRGALYEGERRRRLPLPTYPFERTRCWIDLPDRARPGEPAAARPAEPTAPPRAQPTAPPRGEPVAPPRADVGAAREPSDGSTGAVDASVVSIMSQQVDLMMEQLSLLEHGAGEHEEIHGRNR
ncbi:MAG TPA: type I polyketide synthase [Polyangia bacterium]|nr:type I polyketide synthase [Polyangia bacterium]